MIRINQVRLIPVQVNEIKFRRRGIVGTGNCIIKSISCQRRMLMNTSTFMLVMLSEAGFPPGKFVRANGEKSNLIGWRQTLTSSPANHIRFLLVRANKFAKWKTGLSVSTPGRRKFYLTTVEIETFDLWFASWLCMPTELRVQV